MNKKIGWLCIFLAILFINIIPDPTDIVTLQVYSAVTGANVSPSNLSSVYMDFIVWSLIVGLIFLFFGMWMLGWNWKKIIKKIDVEKYKLFIGLSTLSVVLVSIFNIQFPYLFFLIVPFLYWVFVRHDKSEILGIYGSIVIIFIGGIGEVVQYIINRNPIPELLPHLNSNFFLSWLSTMLGFTQVNNIVLFIGIAISFLLVILYSRVLKEFF